MTNPTELTDGQRCDQVSADFERLMRIFQLPNFSPVHPGRWRDANTGFEIETGYSRGEGRLRAYDEGNGNEPFARYLLTGREGELDTFLKIVGVTNAGAVL